MTMRPGHSVIVLFASTAMFRAASNLPGYGPAETLDQLLARLTGQPGGMSGDEPDLFTELLAAPDDTSSSGDVGELLFSVLHRAGQEVAQLSPTKLASVVARRLGQPRTRRSDPVPTHSLLLINPNDRLAMVPQIDVDVIRHALVRAGRADRAVGNVGRASVLGRLGAADDRRGASAHRERPAEHRRRRGPAQSFEHVGGPGGRTGRRGDGRPAPARNCCVPIGVSPAGWSAGR